MKYLTLSLVAILLFIGAMLYKTRNDNRMYGMGVEHYSYDDDRLSIKVRGCLLWNDKTLQIENLVQHFTINIYKYKQQVETCTVIDTWEFTESNSVRVGDPEQCEITKADTKLTVVKYRDVHIFIRKDSVDVVSEHPKEAGGMRLGNCLNSNYFLFKGEGA